jgi:hypothetical protein
MHWSSRHGQSNIRRKQRAGGRQFSLDGYASDAHMTYALYNAEPSYEQVRGEATQVIAQKKSR